MKKPLKRNLGTDIPESDNIVKMNDAIKDVVKNNIIEDNTSPEDTDKHKNTELSSGFAEIVAAIIKSQLGDNGKNINVADITEVYDPDKETKKPIARKTRKKTESKKTTAKKTVSKTKNDDKNDTAVKTKKTTNKTVRKSRKKTEDK